MPLALLLQVADILFHSAYPTGPHANPVLCALLCATAFVERHRSGLAVGLVAPARRALRDTLATLGHLRRMRKRSATARERPADESET